MFTSRRQDCLNLPNCRNRENIQVFVDTLIVNYIEKNRINVSFFSHYMIVYGEFMIIDVSILYTKFRKEMEIQ